MIDICVFDDGEKRRLTMDGHAGYNPGNDIVCASASALLQAFIMWAQNNKGAKGLTVRSRVANGKAELIVKKAGRISAWDMLLCGLLGLEKTYPAHVQVAEKNNFKF